MGWASGSGLFESVAPALKKIKKADRKMIYSALVEWADSEDWDTHDEAFDLDPVLDEVLKEKGHGYDEDEDGDDLDD